MADPFTLYLCDLFFGFPDNVHSSSTGYSTAPKVLNGDPTDLWQPGATTASIIIGTTGAYTVKAFGVAGHNLKGRNVEIFHGAAATGPWGSFGSLTGIPTPDAFLVTCGSGASNNWFKLTFSGGATAIEIGVISLLGNYGYDADGDLNVAAGGIIQLKNEASQGVPLPIGRGLMTAESRTYTPGNIPQVISNGQACQRFDLSVDVLRGGDDYEWWRVVRSYEEKRNYRWTNRGWHKGVWLTTDQYTVAMPRAYYCIPEAPPAWAVTRKGGRITGQLSLVALPE